MTVLAALFFPFILTQQGESKHCEESVLLWSNFSWESVEEKTHFEMWLSPATQP